jgi:CBS domain-containing protein
MRQPFHFPPPAVEMQALAIARLDQTFLRPAHGVDGDMDIVSVARLFQSERMRSVLVRCADGPGGLGIFTASSLHRAILDGRALDRLPVRDLATRPLIALPPQAPVFDALALMIRHQIHRVVVMEGERILGLLEQLDALSFVSNHSYLVTVQIAQAETLDALAPAAAHITRLVALLHQGGMHVAAMARLVQEING